MTKYRSLVETAIQNVTFDQPLEEGWKDTAKAALLGGALAFGGQAADAKTDYDALHANHEITMRREHGGKGYHAVTMDNYGGYSWGNAQISTERRHGRPSTFDFFMRYLRDNAPGIHTQLVKAGGQPAAFTGEQQFRDTWKKLEIERILEKYMMVLY